MYGIVLTIDIIAAIMVIILVLLQQGKGADMGVSMGGGNSNTVFGSKGPASFLFKATVFFTALFFVCCLLLGYISKKSSDSVVANSAQNIASQYDYNQYQKDIGKASTATKDDKSSKKSSKKES